MDALAWLGVALSQISSDYRRDMAQRETSRLSGTPTLSSATVSSSAFWPRATTVTCAPFFTSIPASALPSPADPPVM